MKLCDNVRETLLGFEVFAVLKFSLFRKHDFYLDNLLLLLLLLSLLFFIVLVGNIGRFKPYYLPLSLPNQMSPHVTVK